nr:MAG TPA: hypothetical protein [Bacteriophage sp.]
MTPYAPLCLLVPPLDISNGRGEGMKKAPWTLQGAICRIYLPAILAISSSTRRWT